jgi:putative copper resistance protein D
MPNDGGSELITTFHFLVAMRWIYFSAIFGLFGSSLFWFYIKHEWSPDRLGGLPKTFRETVLLSRIAAPIAAICGLAWLGGILANMTGGFGSLIDPETLRLFLFETGFGPVAILRVSLLCAAVVIAFLPWNNRVRQSALLTVSALLLVSQAWLGHAAEGGAGRYGAAMIIVYSVHVLAAGAWVGGLPPLLFSLVEQRRSQQALRWTINILSRYSLMAMVAVTLIVISGITNAGFRVAGSFSKLFETNYGDVLFIKFGFVTVMLSLAFFNRFVLMAKLNDASLDGVGQITTLIGSIALELVLGITVLAAAAVLGITPPPQ